MGVFLNISRNFSLIFQPKSTSTPVKEDSPKPISTTEIEIPNEIPIREATPDIIRKSPVKEAVAPAAPISAPTVI